MQCHPALVAAANTAGFRVTAKRHDIHKWLGLVAIFVEGLEPIKIRRLGQLRVQGGLDTPNHRYKVRHEGYAHRPGSCQTQALADFRQVPMPGGAVGLEAFTDLTM